MLYTNDLNALAFDTNGADVARFDTSENFGIGTTSPGANLHVSSGAGSNGNSVLLLEVDTDNAIETANPCIQLQQDCALVDGILGQTGAADTDPCGATYTNANNNTTNMTAGLGDANNRIFVWLARNQ